MFKSAAVEFWKQQALELREELLKPCQVCDTLRKENDYLRSQIERLHADRKEERDEFKRTVDLLLKQRGMEPVGQGPSAPVGKEAKISDLLNLMNMEVEDGQVRPLSESEMK